MAPDDDPMRHHAGGPDTRTGVPDTRTTSRAREPDTRTGDPTIARVPDQALPLALLAAAALLLGTGTPPRTQVLYLLVVGVLLIGSMRFSIGKLAIPILFLVGVHLRYAYTGGGSDVLDVVAAAIADMDAGGNPYGHGYAASTPPGAPYAYGPIPLLWYRITEPARLELIVSSVILALLALRGRTLGLAIYAAAPAFILTASDGSNDTSAGAFLLFALLVAARSPTAGGVMLAVAAAFKPYAVAWLPPLFAFGGIAGPLAGFAAGTLATWGPALLIWGPRSVLTSFQLSDAAHRVPYYSLLYALSLDGPGMRELFERSRYVAGIILAAGSWLVVRSAGSMVLWGCVIFFVTLFFGFWSTFAYIAAIAPVVCWHIDEWLGLAEQRVRWSGDPIGRITAWADSHWPVRSGSGTPRIIGL